MRRLVRANGRQNWPFMRERRLDMDDPCLTQMTARRGVSQSLDASSEVGPASAWRGQVLLWELVRKNSDGTVGLGW